MKQKENRAKDGIGKDSNMVKLHKADNSVSTNPKNNNFISAGFVKMVYREALSEEYPGGLCEGALCSYRDGAARFCRVVYMW